MSYLNIQNNHLLASYDHLKVVSPVQAKYFYIKNPNVLQLRPNPNMGDNFADLPNVFLPVLWFSAEANVTEAMAAQIWWLVNIPIIARYSTAGPWL
jgi:hypothetical protein